MNIEKNYLRWLTILIVGMIVSISGLNWLVNPYSIFKSPNISHFNANKPDYVSHLRLTHIYRTERLKPKCILLGTSRTGRGLAPSHPALADLKCYSMALPGINMYEMRRYLQHVQSIQPQSLEILALDLRVFNPEIDNSGAFSEARLRVNTNGEKRFNLFSARLPDLTSSLISLSALQASLTTIRKQEWVRDTLASDGFWQPLTDHFDHIRGFSAYTFTSAKQFKEMQPNEDIYFKNMEEFRLLLRMAYSQGTKVILIIHPSHAWHWQTLWFSGLWPRFEDMKRQMVAINDQEALRTKRDAFPIWDFSGSYGPALEPIAKNAKSMRWFWEPVHYKQALGDVVLNRVMGIANSEPVLESFGIRLGAAQLESQLAYLRKLQAEYKQNYPDDVARIKSIMDDVNNSGV